VFSILPFTFALLQMGGGGGGWNTKNQWHNSPAVRLELSIVQIHAIKFKIILHIFELQKNILYGAHFNECIQVSVQFSISIYPFL
jgi:arabinogalactan endo-1,4-beta-galactosidase